LKKLNAHIYVKTLLVVFALSGAVYVAYPPLAVYVNGVAAVKECGNGQVMSVDMVSYRCK
jgi:hypothetical protein